MNLQDLFQEVESLHFDMGLSILSGFSTVQNVLPRDETVMRLIQALQAAPENPPKTLQRIRDLLHINDNPQYLHRSDSALTGYLYALNAVDSELAQQAAEAILQVHNLHWAKRLAHHLQAAQTEIS